jgi:hypothetical protein
MVALALPSVARVYFGMPFLGVDRTLLRIERASGEGWC